MTTHELEDDTMTLVTDETPAEATTPRCGRPEGDGQCLRPLTDVPQAPGLTVAPLSGRCSRHGVVTEVVMGAPRDPRRKRTIGGRDWQLRLGEDLDAAIDARAARDGTSPHDALRAMLRERAATDTP